MYIDSHCHLNHPGLSERIPEVLDNMAKNHVTHALCVCVNLATLPDVLALAKTYGHLFASVGVHPDEPAHTNIVTTDILIEHANDARVIAIGETGLDYFRLANQPNRDVIIQQQQERFRQHILASKQTKKPLIIHTRGASEDTLQILEKEKAGINVGGVGGVVHCFTESWEVAKAAIAMGFYISFSGIVTFKNAKTLHEVARQIPLEKMLIETDAPYLAPMPHRGKTNEPAWVVHVAQYLATLKGVSVTTLAAQTTENFFRLFFNRSDS